MTTTNTTQSLAAQTRFSGIFLHSGPLAVSETLCDYMRAERVLALPAGSFWQRMSRVADFLADMD